MRAVSLDVRAALQRAAASTGAATTGAASTGANSTGADRADADGARCEAGELTGDWPLAGHRYLERLVFGSDPACLRVLASRRLEGSSRLIWAAVTAGAALGAPPGARWSHLAGLTAAASGYRDRRYALGLYRRAASPVCLTVSTLVASALWLGSPFEAATPNRNILLETLRLLPPAWKLLRVASPEFAALDERIAATDDVLMLPLLTHRDPALWPEPDEFRPERWDGVDADRQPGYLPFGHASERCWGRHLIMPLAGHLLDRLRRDGLTVSPEQTTATVALAGLLGAAPVRVGRARA
jgi:hypothetical protein